MSKIWDAFSLQIAFDLGKPTGSLRHRLAKCPEARYKQRVSLMTWAFELLKIGRCTINLDGELQSGSPEGQQLTAVQLLFLDGIRYSVRMIGLSYQRLKALAVRLSDDKRVPSDDDFTNTFLDAWFIVDSSDRLRRLVKSLPGLKKNDPNLVLFFNRTESVEMLRNFIQHAEGDVRDLAQQQRPFWGSVSWYRIYTPLEGRICSMRAGSAHQEQESTPLINPLGRTLRAPVDLITLHAAGFEVCLSDVARAAAAASNDIAQQIQDKFKVVSPGASSDLFVTLDLTARDDGTEGAH